MCITYSAKILKTDYEKVEAKTQMRQKYLNLQNLFLNTHWLYFTKSFFFLFFYFASKEETFFHSLYFVTFFFLFQNLVLKIILFF